MAGPAGGHLRGIGQHKPGAGPGAGQVAAGRPGLSSQMEQLLIQPPFPNSDQMSPSFYPDDYGRFKRSTSKFRPDFHLDLHKSIDKLTFRERLSEFFCQIGSKGRRRPCVFIWVPMVHTPSNS